MIMPNGEAQSYSLSKFRRRDESYAIPGTIIVVRREARPAWLGIAATMTPLITSSAVSIASIIALLDN
jgi:hypothetical protein